MRLVNYEVKTVDGSNFTTTKYAEATTAGNRITKTFLTEYEKTPEKQQEWFKKHREKVREKFNF